MDVIRLRLKSGINKVSREITLEKNKTSTSQSILQDIRTAFEKILKHVTGEETCQATTDTMKRGLFKMPIETLFLRCGHETTFART
ncbi:MAG: hypothetical protein OHK0010_32550 [Anaerolineales bacterium]